MPQLLPAIADLIKTHKLEAHANRISAGLVPALRIARNAVNKSAPARSKFGGNPDLPASTPWPETDGRPLHFLAQLRLSELPRTHISDLPPHGWLYFWYDSLEESTRQEREYIDTTAWDPPLAHLTFDPDESRPLSPRTLPDKPDGLELVWGDWEPFAQTALSFEPIWCLDATAAVAILNAEDKADRKHGSDRVHDFLAAIENRQPRGTPDHRLLGDLYESQTNNRFAAACMAAQVAEYADHSDTDKLALDKAAAEYRLLLRLDSDADGSGFVWGDAGSLQWWIRRADLAAGKLETAVGLYDQGS